jgi:hypothetical protein
MALLVTHHRLILLFVESLALIPHMDSGPTHTNVTKISHVLIVSLLRLIKQVKFALGWHRRYAVNELGACEPPHVIKKTLVAWNPCTGAS